jgi:hypothetical protein
MAITAEQYNNANAIQRTSFDQYRNLKGFGGYNADDPIIFADSPPEGYEGQWIDAKGNIYDNRRRGRHTWFDDLMGSTLGEAAKLLVYTPYVQGAALGLGAAGAFGGGASAAGAAGAGAGEMATFGMGGSGLSGTGAMGAGATAAGAGSISGYGAGEEAASGLLGAGETGAGTGGTTAGLGGGSGTFGGGTTFTANTALAPEVTNAVSQAAQVAGQTLTPAQLQGAAQIVANQYVIGTWTAPQLLQAASLALTAVSTGAAMLGGGDKTVTGTTTTTPTGAGTSLMPGGGANVGGGGATGGGGTSTLNADGTPKTAGAFTFEDYINDFYGLSGGQSVQSRIAGNVAGQTGLESKFLTDMGALDTGHLANTKAAVSPYQQQLAEALGQSQTKTGYFQPFNYSFGGKAMPSFVPKNQISTMNAALGTGRESSSVATGLEDLDYNAKRLAAERALGFGTAHPTNEAADTYSAKLEALMKYLNPNTGTTQTTTGTVPGVPWYSTLLQGLNTGVNFYDKISNPRTNSSTTLTAADLAAIKAAYGG